MIDKLVFEAFWEISELTCAGLENRKSESEIPAANHLSYLLIRVGQLVGEAASAGQGGTNVVVGDVVTDKTVRTPVIVVDERDRHLRADMPYTLKRKEMYSGLSISLGACVDLTVQAAHRDHRG